MEWGFLMSKIKLSKISKTYKAGLFKKKVRALTDLSLSVDAGTVYGLIGPNGAGKSTTIRLLLNLSRPDRGTVRIDALPVHESLGAIGYLPENPYLYDHLTLKELLFFAGRATGLATSDIRQRMEHLTATVGLDHVRGKSLRTFSKGMRQRAGLCFALLHDPSLVILDEPMSGLDPLGRKMVCDLILSLKKQGKTIFFCSHILSDIERLCDRIAVLHQGQMVREFTPDEITELRQGKMDLETEFIDVVERNEVHS